MKIKIWTGYTITKVHVHVAPVITAKGNTVTKLY